MGSRENIIFNVVNSRGKGESTRWANLKFRLKDELLEFYNKSNGLNIWWKWSSIMVCR